MHGAWLTAEAAVAAYLLEGSRRSQGHLIRKLDDDAVELVS